MQPSNSFEDEQIAARIAVARVLTLDGETVRLRELWRDSVSVTGFLRHFGCLFCHQMVEDLVTAVPEIISRGAKAILIGNGSIEQAQRFFASKGLPREGVVLATDPERESFRIAGFERGYTRTFLNPTSIRGFAQARKEGHRITGLFGDLTQLGGVLVTRPPALLVYLHRSKFAGDHPEMAEVLRAVESG
jgi:hypothetical protein